MQGCSINISADGYTSSTWLPNQVENDMRIKMRGETASMVDYDLTTGQCLFIEASPQVGWHRKETRTFYNLLLWFLRRRYIER